MLDSNLTPVTTQFSFREKNEGDAVMDMDGKATFWNEAKFEVSFVGQLLELWELVVILDLLQPHQQMLKQIIKVLSNPTDRLRQKMSQIRVSAKLKKYIYFLKLKMAS